MIKFIKYKIDDYGWSKSVCWQIARKHNEFLWTKWINFSLHKYANCYTSHFILCAFISQLTGCCTLISSFLPYEHNLFAFAALFAPISYHELKSNYSSIFTIAHLYFCKVKLQKKKSETKTNLLNALMSMSTQSLV